MEDAQWYKSRYLHHEGSPLDFEGQSKEISNGMAVIAHCVGGVKKDSCCALCLMVRLPCLHMFHKQSAAWMLSEQFARNVAGAGVV